MKHIEVPKDIFVGGYCFSGNKCGQCINHCSRCSFCSYCASNKAKVNAKK